MEENDVEVEGRTRQSTSPGGVGEVMRDQIRMKRNDLRVAKMMLLMQMRLMSTLRLRVVGYGEGWKGR